MPDSDGADRLITWTKLGVNILHAFSWRPPHQTTENWAGGRALSAPPPHTNPMLSSLPENIHLKWQVFIFINLSSHPLVLWDIDSSYLNGTFPLVRGLGSQPSRPSSHSVRGASKHCQSACAAPSPPFSLLLVYLGSRDWWWAPGGKIVEGIVDAKDFLIRGNVSEDTCVPKHIGHTCHFPAAPVSALLSGSCWGESDAHLLSLHTFSLTDSDKQYFSHVTPPTFFESGSVW